MTLELLTVLVGMLVAAVVALSLCLWFMKAQLTSLKSALEGIGRALDFHETRGRHVGGRTR